MKYYLFYKQAIWEGCNLVYKGSVEGPFVYCTGGGSWLVAVDGTSVVDAQERATKLLDALFKND